MALLSDYTAGTVSVAANGTAVTGVGTAWKTAGFKEGDWFIANGWVNVIASVDSETTLTLAQPWRGGALTAATYRLRYMSDGSRVSAQARQLIDMLGGSGSLEALSSLVGLPDTFPMFTGPGAMTLVDKHELVNDLGATAIGIALFTAADAEAAQDAIGATATGKAVITAANAGAVRTAAGITATGSNIVTASNQANARTALGAGSVGDALFTAEDANTARGAIGADLLRGMRNKIINGTFEFATRGLSFSTSATSRYTLDRWFQDTSGSTMAVSRTTLGVGTAESFGGGATYCADITVTAGSGASDRARLLQRIENVRTLAGKKVTVSFCARANSGTPSMAVNFTQNFGTGGSPSAAVVATGQKIGLTANWQYFKLTFDIPSVSGKTVGTNDDDFLALDLWFDAGSTYNSQTGSLGHQSNRFYITKVQVAEGDLTAEADPFEERLAAVEQALCERYFQLSLMWPAVWYNASNPASLTCGVTLPVTMRAAPTVTAHVNPAVLEPGVANRNLVGLPTTAIGVKGGQLDFTTQTPTAAFKVGFVQPGSFKIDAEL